MDVIFAWIVLVGSFVGPWVGGAILIILASHFLESDLKAITRDMRNDR